MKVKVKGLSQSSNGEFTESFTEPKGESRRLEIFVSGARRSMMFHDMFHDMFYVCFDNNRTVSLVL